MPSSSQVALGEKSKPDSIVHLCFCGMPMVAGSDHDSEAADLEQLKSMVNSQQILLEQQQAQIQALQLALAEQKQILAGIVQPHNRKPSRFQPRQY